jgi:cytochrome c-type biogenesis protein CcmH
MSGFLFVAAAMALVALALVVVPLLRRRGDGTPASLVTAVACIVVGGGAAAALYPAFSDYSWEQPSTDAVTPEAMVGRLARRLESQPDDLKGWLQLGRSYSVLGQYALAARAYQRADTLAGNKDPEALTGLAEALVLGQQSELSGRAGRLFERAVELDPRSTKALFYSAVAALERQDLPLARERFTTLLSGNPPPEVRRIIEEQIRAIDAAPPAVAAAPGAPAAAAAGGASPAAGGSPAAGTAAVVIDVRVTLAPAVRGQMTAGAPLFVVARDPERRGPPLAAKRLEATFPQDVQLASTDAMIAGNGFTAGQEVEVVARIANGGGAIAKSGDPVGTAKVRAGQGGRIDIVIDRLTP